MPLQKVSQHVCTRPKPKATSNIRRKCFGQIGSNDAMMCTAVQVRLHCVVRVLNLVRLKLRPKYGKKKKLCHELWS